MKPDKSRELLKGPRPSRALALSSCPVVVYTSTPPSFDTAPLLFADYSHVP